MLTEDAHIHVALTVDEHIQGQSCLPCFKDTENEAQRSWECPKASQVWILLLVLFLQLHIPPLDRGSEGGEGRLVPQRAPEGLGKAATLD